MLWLINKVSTVRVTEQDVAYWGAFQASGDNISANLDRALAAEQDLVVRYDFAINDALGLCGGLTYYLYPAADKAVIGASVPSPWYRLARIRYHRAMVRPARRREGCRWPI